MKVKKLDLKRAHFGSKQEEWSYLQLLLLEEISGKLDKLIDMFSPAEIPGEEIPEGETGEIEVIEKKANTGVTVRYEIEEKKKGKKPKKRGRKKKKADDNG